LFLCRCLSFNFGPLPSGEYVCELLTVSAYTKYNEVKIA
jgi:hypothetical protein